MDIGGKIATTSPCILIKLCLTEDVVVKVWDRYLPTVDFVVKILDRYLPTVDIVANV